MEQELEYLGRAVANPEHPYIAILGGAKISDKILVVETLPQNVTNSSSAAAWRTPSFRQRD
jgi:phosphoglycerate kinase